jgi:hypothetical protein
MYIANVKNWQKERGLESPLLERNMKTNQMPNEVTTALCTK